MPTPPPPPPAKAAPVLHYVHHSNFTPTHRARLSKSHKKIEQILGVTPSLQPIPPQPTPAFTPSLAPTPTPTPALIPSSSPHKPRVLRRAKSSISPTPSSKTRRKLLTLFGIELPSNPSSESDDTKISLYPISTISSSSSSSSSLSSSTESLSKPLPQPPLPHRPHLRIDCSNLGNNNKKQDNNNNNNNDLILDIRPSAPNSNNINNNKNKIEVESPITPLYALHSTHRQRSRESILEEREWNKIILGVTNLPISSKEKSRKLNRLGKVFGLLPPLEMVFPPTPTSRSRHDPKRYTLELPPPLIRGTLTDSHAHPQSLNTTQLEEEDSHSYSFPTDNDDKKVMRVVWDTITDEPGRQKVMEALRLLRA